MAMWILSLSTLLLTASFCAGQDDKPLPGFAKKFSLLGFDGAVAGKDGKAIELYRVPASVRQHLNQKSREQMHKMAHGEIRFVLNEGEKLENVAVHVQMDGKAVAYVDFFYGDYQYWLFNRPVRGGAKLKFPTHGVFSVRKDRVPNGRYPTYLCRMVFNGPPMKITGVEGDIRAPRADELPPIMVAYGTSITQGARASRADLSWPALTARVLGYDLVNLGSSGSAFCEPQMADYIATLDWELCVLSLSVNMVRRFSVEAFQQRAEYFVNTVAAAKPDATVACISLFPYFVDFDREGPNKQKVAGYRQALEQICRDSKHKNIRFFKGTDLLSPTGLTQDLIHPGDHGMIEIAQKLTAGLKDLKVPSYSTTR